MPKYKEYSNREEWLQARTKTIGASETASALGMGFNSQLDLWREKTGRKEHSDLSANSRVQYGTQAEEHIRALFALQNESKYKVEYHEFRVYEHDKYPYMTCTLDGELERLEDGKHGILEIKTAWIKSKNDLLNWENNSIPQHYYCQICQQLAVTGYDFAILYAQLIFSDGKSELRPYLIERGEVLADIEYVEQEVTKFWGYVEKDTQPPTTLTL